MEEAKKKAQELVELKGKLVSAVKQEMEQGLQRVNTHEMGEVVDMIKDLAEAEEKCWKAFYYKSIAEAMHESKKQEELMMKMRMSESDGQEEMGRMGYDNWRYSSGRFAPTGKGHFSSGYHPMDEDMMPWMMQPWAESMGYSRGSSGGSSGSGGGRSGGNSGGGRGGNSGGSSRSSGSSGYSGSSGSSGYSGSSGSSGGGSNSGSGGSNGRMGYHGSERGDRYERYNEARLGYHESKDSASKEHMDATAREYVVDMAEAVKEVWKDADPAMRKEIKNKFIALTGEMN